MSIKKEILAWLTKEERLQKYPFLRRFFWKRGPIYREMELRAARMRQKEVITVVFMVLNLPCWKCDSVFRLMQQHPRFRPIIWLVPELQIKDVDERERNLEQMRTFFAGRCYPVADLYSLEQLREEFAPDIVFLAKPYIGTTHWDVWDMDRELVCYVPYCFINTQSASLLYGLENRVWRNFYQSRSLWKLCEKKMANAGANVVVTGAPFTDAFFSPEDNLLECVWKECGAGKKRLIWAPHWSVAGDSWFSVATFCDMAEGMLQLAEKYVERIQWSFKPHPLLRGALYQHPDWGQERTEAYYERWATMPNTQLETGDYEALFKQSDAMIHDCGSFIMEYLLVDKPCLYLQRGEGFHDFNEDTLKALDCYRKGHSVADVEAFIEDLLAGVAQNEMSRARAQYSKRCLHPPHRCSAAQNIVAAILKSR